MRSCEHCGAEFEPHHRALSRQRFCSDDCGKKASYRRLAGPSPLGQHRACATCGSDYATVHVAQRYCSGTCKRAAARAKVPQRWRHVSSRYGMSPAVFDAILAAQDGGCAICGIRLDGTGRERSSPQVDHDHETGVVRQILCRLCNTALGNFRDDPEIVSRALEYLRRWKSDEHVHRPAVR